MKKAKLSISILLCAFVFMLCACGDADTFIDADTSVSSASDISEVTGNETEADTDAVTLDSDATDAADTTTSASDTSDTSNDGTDTDDGTTITYETYGYYGKQFKITAELLKEGHYAGQYSCHVYEKVPIIDKEWHRVTEGCIVYPNEEKIRISGYFHVDYIPYVEQALDIKIRNVAMGDMIYLDLLKANVPNNIENIIDEDIHHMGTYKTVDGVLYSGPKESYLKLYYFPTGREGEYTVIDGTTMLMPGSFSGSKLTKVYLPKSVTEYEGAFDEDSDIEIVWLD